LKNGACGRLAADSAMPNKPRPTRVVEQAMAVQGAEKPVVRRLGGPFANIG
jgi:hypothetical protein